MHFAILSTFRTISSVAHHVLHPLGEKAAKFSETQHELARICTGKVQWVCRTVCKYLVVKQPQTTLKRLLKYPQLKCMQFCALLGHNPVPCTICAPCIPPLCEKKNCKTCWNAVKFGPNWPEYPRARYCEHGALFASSLCQNNPKQLSKPFETPTTVRHLEFRAPLAHNPVLCTMHSISLMKKNCKTECNAVNFSRDWPEFSLARYCERGALFVNTLWQNTLRVWADQKAHRL